METTDPINALFSLKSISEIPFTLILNDVQLLNNSFSSYDFGIIFLLPQFHTFVLNGLLVQGNGKGSFTPNHVAFLSNVPLLKLSGVHVFVANNIVCKNNTYRSRELAQMNLIQISRITVIENAPKQYTITNAVIESSPFNLLLFEGFVDNVLVTHA